MNIIKYPMVLLMAFSLVFVGGEAEAKGKHSSEKTRTRVMKEIAQHSSFKEKPAKAKSTMMAKKTK